MSYQRPPTLGEQCDALASQCVPWRMTLPDGATRKRVEGQINGDWHLVPEGIWTISAWIREVRAS